jgi:hypothetical protein
MMLSPRIRDLGKITLVRAGTPTGIGERYPHAGPLLSARWNEDLVAGCWDDLLRMAGSLKYGRATASLVVGKSSAASRQNTLAAALKEWGTLRRTIHAAKYLSDPAYGRKIARQLYKGESLPALRRDLHYAHQGTVTKPYLADQNQQAWCLTALTNAVIRSLPVPDPSVMQVMSVWCHRSRVACVVCWTRAPDPGFGRENNDFDEAGNGFACRKGRGRDRGGVRYRRGDRGDAGSLGRASVLRGAERRAR